MYFSFLVEVMQKIRSCFVSSYSPRNMNKSEMVAVLKVYILLGKIQFLHIPLIVSCILCFNTQSSNFLSSSIQSLDHRTISHSSVRGNKSPAVNPNSCLKPLPSHLLGADFHSIISFTPSLPLITTSSFSLLKP